MAGKVLLDLLHSQRQPSQIYCAFVSDWLSFRVDFFPVCRVCGERVRFTTSCQSGTFPQDLSRLCLPASPRASHPASELTGTRSTPAATAPVVAVMFAVSQDPSGMFYRQSVVSRTAFIWSWHLKGTATEEGRGLSGKRTLLFGFGLFTADCSFPACYSFPKNFACS